MVQINDETIARRDVVIIICLFFSAFASLLPDEINRLALYGALPFAFALSFFKNRSLRINTYSNILFLLYIWIGISSLWAVYANYANTELHRVLGGFLVCYIMAVNAKNSKMIPWLYSTYLVLYIGAWYYASTHIVMDIGVMGSETDRLNDEKLNANTMAYYTFYATFVLYILNDICQKKILKRILPLAFIAMIPLSFFVALTTASRQVLIIQIPLIALLLYSRYIKNQNGSRKTIFIIFTCVASIFFVSKAISMYEGSYLAERASRDLQDDSRSKLMIDAFNVGIEHLPWGVGAGNYIAYSYRRLFSHISYLELFANQGIIGLFLYINMIFVYMKRGYRRYKLTNDSILFLFLIFGLIYIVDNMFYVFYTDIWLISFFILVASHAETYYNIKYSNS